MSRPVLYLLDPSKDITGAFICAKNEAQLIRNDFEVVLVLPSTSKIGDDMLVDFEKVIRLPMFDLRKSLVSFILYFPMLLLSGWRLRQAMKNDHCQYLQVNDYYLMQGVVARFLGYRGKLVTWIRIDPTRYGSFFSKYWLKHAYSTSDTLVSVSQFILNKLPVSPKNKLLYDPVFPHTHNIRACNTAEHSIKKLIYIGNYIEGKGQQYAIRAFSKVAEKYNNVELHFYGGDMGMKKNRLYRQQLEVEAAALVSSSRIFFHGFVKDVWDILCEGYMLLNFSSSESFSMTCLEASTCALPVVATRSGGPEEIVNNKKTGFLVDNGDVNAMVDAIDRLLSDEILARQMGKDGSTYVKQKFSQDTFKRNIYKVFGRGEF